jgi:hypothetical protein
MIEGLIEDPRRRHVLERTQADVARSVLGCPT